MEVYRPPWVRAGFHAELDTGDSGLVHAGEQWAPAHFLIPPHTHPVWEFYLQVHGDSRWLADGQPFTLRPGHLFGVSPGVRHHMADESSRHNHFCFAAIDLAPVLGRHPHLAEDWRDLPATVQRPRAHALAESFAQLSRELTAAHRHAVTGLSLAVDWLVLELTRHLRADRPSTVLAGHPAVATVRKLLEHDSARRWTLAELAAAVGLVPGYLAALFTRDVGMSPHRYLNEHRIRRARRLLATSDLPVTAIGIEVGFASGQHFARVFRQITGQTPGGYRRGHQRV